MNSYFTFLFCSCLFTLRIFWDILFWNFFFSRTYENCEAIKRSPDFPFKRQQGWSRGHGGDRPTLRQRTAKWAKSYQHQPLHATRQMPQCVNFYNDTLLTIFTPMWVGFAVCSQPLYHLVELFRLTKIHACIMRPERPKGVKDKVKRPKGSPARTQGPEGPQTSSQWI